MRDVLAPESARWRRFVEVFADVVESAGYHLIIPPLLEDLGVFTRIGTATDVVTKEMYDFIDKGDRHLALRPEFTAGVCRAFAQHRPSVPWKVWYAGPNFRYERPQRGRYRQFEQVGIEVLGVDDPYLDVEVIALGWEFFTRLGLSRVTLQVNSLGEPDDRRHYVEALRSYFGANRDALSEQSLNTLELNPLRVLDSKRPEDREVLDGAPRIAEFRSAAATAHYATVLEGLAALGIDFVENERLVRGLDYYRRTTFEYTGGTLESAQNALGGGGRYDGLVAELGGPPTAGIGFALGVDRTLLACDDEGVFAAPERGIDIFVVDTTDGAAATVLTAEIRALGWTADRAFDQRSMKAQMRAADRSGARIAVIVGPDEVANGTIIVRSLREGADQLVIESDRLAETVERHLGAPPSRSGDHQ